MTREKWRSFLRRREEHKHQKYDVACAMANWDFKAMAFGTWGGMGPEGAKILHRLSNRAASWQEGDLRASLQEQGKMAVGLALMRQTWSYLETKNFVS